jgi:TolB protein
MAGVGKSKLWNGGRAFALGALAGFIFAASAPQPADESERIAYSSFASGTWEIWSMHAGGSQQKQLTVGPWDKKSPALSPDGRQVAYSNNKGEIWVAEGDGSNARALPLPKGFNAQPCWAPDGSKIVYSARPSPLEERAFLYFVELSKANQTAARRLLEMPGVAMCPDCSPDGKQIVFSHFEIKKEDLKLPRAPVVEELFVLDVATGRVRQLTKMGKNCTSPRYSPDGSQVLFSSNAAGSYDLWIAPADGAATKPAQLTSDPGYEGTPCWSPDGSRIAFTSSRTGNLEIWVMDRDGKNWRPLTRSRQGRDSSEPSWRRMKPTEANPSPAKPVKK